MNRNGISRMLSRQIILVVSAVLALVSTFFAPADTDYQAAVDVRTICLLFCLMVAVAGINASGAFTALASKLLLAGKSMRTVCGILIALPTALSMLITNDVSLILFVPIAVAVLESAGRRDLIIPVAVLQTLGANTGSILLPFGNPQNILICSRYSVGLSEFVSTTLPLAVAGIAVMLFLFARIPNGKCTHSADIPSRIDWCCFSVMSWVFVLAVASVMGFADFRIAVVFSVIVALIIRPSVLGKVDYGLLLTFFCLFVFVANISAVESIGNIFGDIAENATVLGSALLSQAVSNVPAALMLSAFTDNWQGLLAGVSIGGFGTPIASMASLITFRLYSRTDGADMRLFVGYFAVANILMLAVLIPAAVYLFGL